MPVLLSGGIWVQSTLSRVNMVSGSFGFTSIASTLVPGTTRWVMLKRNLVYAAVTVAEVATSRPLTHTFAEPMTPLTISVATWPDRRLGVKSARHHHGTLNRATVSAPTAFMKP